MKARLCKWGLSLAGVLVLGSLGACTSLDGDQVDYGKASQAPSLIVPPDLSQLPEESRYNIPGQSVSASAYGSRRPASSAAAVAGAIDNPQVRIERDGNRRWLVVQKPAGQLWASVADFWKEMGFHLTRNDPALGIMETDWIENRGKINAQNGFFNRMLKALIDTGIRDQYRTRFERVGDQSTEIYISHRAIQEVAISPAAVERPETKWQEAPNNSDLEAELINRLALKLGVSQSNVPAVASAPKKPKARVVKDEQTVHLELDDNFERAWRKLGVALDRTGFTVEDRDRSQGSYFVRYVDALAAKDEPGFWARLFGAKGSGGPQKYKIVLKAVADTSSWVTVLKESGEPEDSRKSEKLLDVLAEDLQ